MWYCSKCEKRPVTGHGVSSDQPALQPAENSAPFVHHYFGGALPLREKRSGY